MDGDNKAMTGDNEHGTAGWPPGGIHDPPPSSIWHAPLHLDFISPGRKRVGNKTKKPSGGPLNRSRMAQITQVQCHAGSGYLTGCLGIMVGHTGQVLGVEKHTELAERSMASLSQAVPELMKRGTVRIMPGNVLGKVLREYGPFDAIHVGAAAATMPQVRPLPKHLWWKTQCESFKTSNMKPLECPVEDWHPTGSCRNGCCPGTSRKPFPAACFLLRIAGALSAQ